MAISYKDAGVDIDAGNLAVQKMKGFVKSTYRPEVLTDLGSFAGLFALNVQKYKEPVLISGTDGVGTKLRVAQILDKHDTIGIDAVAMCVNDILVQGAEPLFFLDYIAVGKLDPDKVADIVKGVADGCKQSRCSLIGGETAEMPGFYGEDEYDIAGFAVGVADKSKIITGEKVKAGDVLIGLPSTGLHSNGFSLARKVLLEGELKADDYLEELGCTVAEAMLVPTRLYVKDILPLLEKVDIHGMCHITGGGLIENLPRVYGDDVAVEIDTAAWKTPAIFEVMQKQGGIADEEMYRVFNMGVGFVIMVDAADADKVLAECPDGFIMGKAVNREEQAVVLK
ncbi:MAG: phosphoribosylformylglycinamidine cyclo-ligase [Bacillota bacterium]|jgi:phosphoribosylformylglycinamidine cyclo-ligase